MEQQIIRHGEVILKPIDALPQEVIKEQEKKQIIVAHSETGHHHILESTKNIKVYTWNGETYLEVPELSNLWHQKTGKDVHTPHKVQPGIYQINIKKEFDYFAGVIREVRD